MNRYDFTKPGGFPFDQGVMGFIQDSITLAAATATLAGPLAILSGCVVTGDSVSDGIVVINGEILPFTGGLIEDKVVINETASSVLFQDDSEPTVKFVRSAGFGDDGGATDYLWVNFQRNTPAGILARIAELETEVDALNTEVDSLNTDVATLGAEVADLETNKLTKLASGNYNIGDVPATFSNYTIPIGKTLANNNYMVLVTLISQSGTPGTDLIDVISVYGKSTTQFKVYLHEPGPITQNVSLDWMIVSF